MTSADTELEFSEADSHTSSEMTRRNFMKMTAATAEI